MSEKNIQSLCQLAASQAGATVFRNNVANAVAGQMQRIDKAGPVHLNPGDWIVRNGRRTRFGLCVGSSDLIGWKTEIINGAPFARFLAMEIKSSTGRATAEQKNFIEAVRGAGGLAGVVRSVDEAAELVGGYETDTTAQPGRVDIKHRGRDTP